DSSTKPAGPSNTTTASTSGPHPTDTATTANPTPSPHQHHRHPRHPSNHHHSEQAGSGWWAGVQPLPGIDARAGEAAGRTPVALTLHSTATRTTGGDKGGCSSDPRRNET